jgi:hypothetical protein
MKDQSLYLELADLALKYAGIYVAVTNLNYLNSTGDVFLIQFVIFVVSLNVKTRISISRDIKTCLHITNFQLNLRSRIVYFFLS